ncbi:MAG: glycerophosphodiester phosphodiesterase family protein [Chloroflexota bacterium]
MNIEIVCHRGANEYAPENTYAAAQLCIDWGMDYVEVDVNTSKDEVLYLMHGPLIDHTTNGTGYFGELTSHEIDQLDAGSWFHCRYANERIPRLEPFLQWIKGKAKVFLDVKAAQKEQLLEILYRTGMTQDCFLWTASDRWMLEVRQADPSLQLKMNANSVADIVEAAEVYRANIIEVDLDKMDAEIAKACHWFGLRLMIYARGKDEAAYQQVIEWGADMVNLNHGDLFQKVIKRTFVNSLQPHISRPIWQQVGTM